MNSRSESFCVDDLSPMLMRRGGFEALTASLLFKSCEISKNLEYLRTDFVCVMASHNTKTNIIQMGNFTRQKMKE